MELCNYEYEKFHAFVLCHKYVHSLMYGLIAPIGPKENKYSNLIQAAFKKKCTTIECIKLSLTFKELRIELLEQVVALKKSLT